MKTRVLITTLTLFLTFSATTFLFMSCSKDDDSSDSTGDTFLLDGETYSVNLSYLQSTPLPNSNGLSNASIVITGSNGSTIGTLTFSLYHPTGEGVEGTYMPGGDLPSAWTYTNHLTIYSIQNGSNIQNGNYPQGEIKVTAHGGNEYTVQFNLEFSDGIQASGDIRRSFPNP